MGEKLLGTRSPAAEIRPPLGLAVSGGIQGRGVLQGQDHPLQPAAPDRRFPVRRKDVFHRNLRHPDLLF